MSSADKPYQCVECGKSFTEEDTQLYNFFKVTKTCLICYNKGQKADHRTWCFGKVDIIKGGETVRWGYKKGRDECDSKCPDRKICFAFLLQQNKAGEQYRKIDLVRIKRAEEAVAV